MNKRKCLLFAGVIIVFCMSVGPVFADGGSISLNNEDASLVITGWPVNDQLYDFNLDLYLNPSDLVNLYWTLNVDSVVVRDNPGSSRNTRNNGCSRVTLGAGEMLTVTGLQVGDMYYDFILSNYSNPNEFFGYYWRLDMTSLSENTGCASSCADDHCDTCEGSTDVNINSTVTGNIEVSGDHDYFRIVIPSSGFLIPSSGLLSVYTTGSTDTYGELKDSSCSNLNQDDDSGSSSNFRINEQVSTGTYYVAVSAYLNKTGSYTLHIDFPGSGDSPSTSCSCSCRCSGCTVAITCGGTSCRPCSQLCMDSCSRNPRCGSYISSSGNCR
ncbi:MAG: hypothetical protein GY864_04740 [Desulfobacterales bacterium]|nr:hypothetical protein [Desulfobacterales bacterium]